MKRFNVLSVCGSGTVTSSMVAEKLKDALGKKGIRVTATEARPTEALNLAQGGNFDFIIHTSPLIRGDYGIPIVDAVGFLTGFGDEEFINNVMKVVDELSKKKEK